MVQSSEAESSGGRGIPERLYEGYVFDLDGTIYLGDELLPGAQRLVLKLRELGKRVIFLSNNPTKDPKMYAEKLGELGLETPESEIRQHRRHHDPVVAPEPSRGDGLPHKRGPAQELAQGGWDQDVR